MSKKEDPLAPLKESVARELGLWEKVQACGWGGLSAAETGRLGGTLYHRFLRGADGSAQRRNRTRK